MNICEFKQTLRVVASGLIVDSINFKKNTDSIKVPSKGNFSLKKANKNYGIYQL